MSPFQTQAQAVGAAECLCDALRRHGEDVEVCIEEVAELRLPASDQPLSERLAELLREAN